MAQILNADLDPTRIGLVAPWMSRQRWYTAKGATPRPTLLDSWRLDDPAGEVGIETLVVADDAGPEPVVYQVPVTYRDAPLEGAEHALIGTTEHSVLGTRWVYDGPHDPVYVAQLVALLRGRAAAQSGHVSDTPEPGVVGAPHPAWPDEPVVGTTRVLAGEQSNTSIVVEPGDGGGGGGGGGGEGGDRHPVIVKLFRTLAAGDNPDVVLQGALAEAHSPFVPAGVGHVAGAWDRADGQGRDVGQLAVAQEYLPGTGDAWRVCLEEVAAGRSFAEPARALGAATAHVHAALAQVLPTVPATADAVAARVAAMRRRVAGAVSEAPGLSGLEDRVDAALDRAQQADWPALQRIHGDYHLGQVLHVPGRGWVLIDFEGEPLRPLAERSEPDSPMRDVAGMLRSIDYAGASVEGDTRAWVDEAQAAFLDGYAGVADDPRERPDLLLAHLLDKAAYEVVYEARNRPTWLTIPTTAIDRLLEEAPA